MHIKSSLSIFLALTISASGLAVAEDNDPGKNDTRGIGQRPDQRQSHREVRRLQRQNSDPRRDDGRGNYQNRGNGDGRYNEAGRGVPQYQGGDRYDRDGRGAGPNHNFHRGDRLPVEYRNRQYVVDDWRGHRLSAPPRGYQWVQTGGDYVLVAVATGLIAQLLLGN